MPGGPRRKEAGASTIVDGVAAQLPAWGLSAVLLSSPENVAYVMGYMLPSQARPKRTRPISAIITAQGASACVLPTAEGEEARTRANIRDIRLYNEFTDTPMDVVAGVLAELGIANRVVGMETDLFPQKHFARLCEQLPRCTFRDCVHHLETLRMIKTPSEIDTLRAVGRIVDRSYSSLPSRIHAGASELTVNACLASAIIEGGAEGIDRFLIGSGERSAFENNAAPTARQLQRGDVLRIDAFANLGYYRADMARTFGVQSPTAEHRELWRRLVELQNHVLRMIGPGASTAAIFQSYAMKHDALSLSPRGGVKFLGHGIGLTVHERPYIDAYSDALLQPGMVLCIESVHRTPTVGIQLEDEVIVTSDGYERISDGRNHGELAVLG